MNEATKKLVEEVEDLAALKPRRLFTSGGGRTTVICTGYTNIEQAAHDARALCAEVRRLDEENERLRRTLAGAEAIGGVVAIRVSPKDRPCPDCGGTGWDENDGPNLGGPCACTRK